MPKVKQIVQTLRSDGIFGLANWVMRWALFCVKDKLQWITEFSRVPTVGRLRMFIYVCLSNY